MKNVKEKITKDIILKSNKIQRFLNSKRNDNTRPRYEYHILQFFLFINKNPETYLNNEYEFLQLEEKKKTSNMYKRDIEDFKNHLSTNNNKYDRDFKPATIRTILSVIKSLFTFNYIDLPDGFWKRTNDFKGYRVSITDTPTPEQLRKILDNTDLQGKCIFGIMKDSGSRINSVILLKRKDIDLGREFPIIRFYYKNVKNGITKKKRITPETKRFLQSYFEKEHFIPEDRIFPMTRQNGNYKWNCAIKKTNLYHKDENTNRLTMTTHCLKRFFKTNTANIDKALCDYFCEHGNLTDRYYDCSDEKLDKEYSKLVNNLLVYERPYDIDSRVKQMQKELSEVKGSNKLLKNKFEWGEVRINKLESLTENIYKGAAYMKANPELSMKYAKMYKNNKDLAVKELLKEAENIKDGISDEDLRRLHSEISETEIGKKFLQLLKSYNIK